MARRLDRAFAACTHKIVTLDQASSEGSVEPAHMRNIARAFANCTHKIGGAQWLSYRLLDSSLTGVTALWSLSKAHLS